MAKDAKPAKGKKSKVDEAPAKSKKSKGNGGDFANPSEAPASGGDGFKLESDDNIGELFLITPLRVATVKGYKNEDAEVIVCDIVELNTKKPEKSKVHENAYAFGGWVKGALRGFVGERMVLGRLEQDKEKGGGGKNSYAWVLEDGSAADMAVATAYLETVDPFKQKGAKGKAGKSK